MEKEADCLLALKGNRGNRNVISKAAARREMKSAIISAAFQPVPD
jgi:hypothetical protein